MRVLALLLLASVGLACTSDPEPIAAPTAPVTGAPESCYIAEGNICMRITRVSVTCADVGSAADMKCNANVQMTIPTLVTRGQVSVGVRITGNSYVIATIDDVPVATPGALVARAPTQKAGGACITGVSSHIVAVYDGDYPTPDRNGGRPLFIEPVPTNMTCTP